MMFERIDTVTPGEVASAANRWLGDDYLSFRSRVGFHKPTKLESPTTPP